MRASTLTVILLTASFAGCTTDEGTGPPAMEGAVTFEAIRFDTELGSMTVILYPEAAPETVELMKALVNEGYYDGREFTRVVPGHVIQITDKANGATDDPRRVPLETHPDYHYVAGAVGIARGEDPNSGGPEFFIMDFATSHLDGNYSLWGQVVEGMEVVHEAARVPSVPTGDLPGVNMLATDHTAIDAVAIVRAELTELTMNATEAARHPGNVAQNQRNGVWRHSLEWPDDLAAGHASELTWYIRPYDDGAPPPATDLNLTIGDQSVELRDGYVAGIYHWTWTPRSAGNHTAWMTWGDLPVASLVVDVPSGIA